MLGPVAHRFIALIAALIAGATAAVVTSRYVASSSAENQNALPRGARYLAAAYGPDRYSQFAEEWIVRDFFQDKRDGVFVEVGVNLRMPETCAAMGRAQLERLDGLLLARAECVQLYRQAFEAVPGLSFQEPPPGALHAWQTFAVVLPDGKDRKRIIAALADQQIEAGVATYALHRIGSLADRPSIKGRRFPVADALHDRALALPLYGGMTQAEVGRVADALKTALR